MDLHHTGEDRLVWPKLLERGPDETAPLVETMEPRHEGVHTALAAVRERAVEWRRTAAPADRDLVAAAIDAMLPRCWSTWLRRRRACLL